MEGVCGRGVIPRGRWGPHTAGLVVSHTKGTTSRASSGHSATGRAVERQLYVLVWQWSVPVSSHVLTRRSNNRALVEYSVRIHQVLGCPRMPA